ncbi:hypothetical protein [Fructilactobacillus frigidiflavus]|uniref:hypothetical protein n=1 Tax=Fructilactobacillus frigidiflavus TaxID=3242688 RepID=UPI003757BD11
MQIKLKKGNIQQTITFIRNINLSGGKTNRARFRALKLLDKKAQEVNEERMEIAKSYAKLDQSGEPIILQNGNLDIEQEKLIPFSNAQNAMFEEDSALTVDDYKDQFQTLYEALLNYNDNLQGDNLIAYGTLIDVLEDAGFREGE